MLLLTCVCLDKVAQFQGVRAAGCGERRLMGGMRACEQVIFIWSFVSHSLRKSIMTCGAVQTGQSGGCTGRHGLMADGVTASARVMSSCVLGNVRTLARRYKRVEAQDAVKCCSSDSRGPGGGRLWFLGRDGMHEQQMAARETHLGLIVDGQDDLGHASILQCLQQLRRTSIRSACEAHRYAVSFSRISWQGGPQGKCEPRSDG